MWFYFCSYTSTQVNTKWQKLLPFPLVCETTHHLSVLDNSAVSEHVTRLCCIAACFDSVKRLMFWQTFTDSSLVSLMLSCASEPVGGKNVKNNTFMAELCLWGICQIPVGLCGNSHDFLFPKLIRQLNELTSSVPVCSHDGAVPLFALSLEQRRQSL